MNAAGIRQGTITDLLLTCPNLISRMSSNGRLNLGNKKKGNIEEPESMAAAEALWERNKKEFELWALNLVSAKPVVRGNKVHGLLGFVESGRKKEKIAVQVRGDKNLTPGMLLDLLELIEKEGAVIGLLISLHKPRLGLITDSVHAGSYESELWNKKFLRLQIRTVGELLEGKYFDIPQTYSLLKKPTRKKKQGDTAKLL
jgi:hypothetical protein